MPPSSRIALYLDDLGQLSHLLSGLASLDCAVRPYGSARDLVRALHQEHFDLVVLGTPPGNDRAGTLVNATLVRTVQAVPVLQVVVDGWREQPLDLADAPDDFMVWPVRPAELRARILALLMRQRTVRDTSRVQHYGRYTVDSERVRILLDGRPVALRPREFELGRYMFRNAGLVVPRRQVLLAVWQMPALLETRSVDTHMWRLRAALELTGTFGWRLAAVYARGYRLELCDVAENLPCAVESSG